MALSLCHAHYVIICEHLIGSLEVFLGGREEQCHCYLQRMFSKDSERRKKVLTQQILYLTRKVIINHSYVIVLFFSFGFQRRQSLLFTLPSSPFFLPACFFCLVSYLLKRLSLHGSPNWKIMDLINWSLSAIDTIFSTRSLGSGEPVCPDGTFAAGYTEGCSGRGGKSYVWRLFLWGTLRISTFSAP